jgi:hypothetical protein
MREEKEKGKGRGKGTKRMRNRDEGYRACMSELWWRGGGEMR